MSMGYQLINVFLVHLSILFLFFICILHKYISILCVGLSFYYFKIKFPDIATQVTLPGNYFKD